MKLLRPKKSPPRLLTVKTAEFLTPNMRRITFAGPELEGIPQDRDGGNCAACFERLFVSSDTV